MVFQVTVLFYQHFLYCDTSGEEEEETEESIEEAEKLTGEEDMGWFEEPGLEENEDLDDPDWHCQINGGERGVRYRC